MYEYLLTVENIIIVNKHKDSKEMFILKSYEYKQIFMYCINDDELLVSSGKVVDYLFKCIHPSIYKWNLFSLLLHLWIFGKKLAKSEILNQLLLEKACKKEVIGLIKTVITTQNLSAFKFNTVSRKFCANEFF